MPTAGSYPRTAGRGSCSRRPRARALAQPGESLFVGPQDLRRTNYGPTFMYFLLRDLRPASYYMEMNPGTANREGSGLADELRRADWLILTSEWDDWNEPNESVEYRFVRAERGGSRRLLPQARARPVPTLRALRPRRVKTALVTGSSGLIGSEMVVTLDALGWDVHGVDNNMRLDFFGPDGDTTANLERLVGATKRFTHHGLDVRDRAGVATLVGEVRPDLIVHCAAQPSHDLAARRPFDDFDVNAVGTLNLLEAARASCPESPFVFLSTNKVYGDAPNELDLVELETRYDYADPALHEGIDESCRIDATLHSLFGASKAAADLLVQEYGRYFGMPTVCFRGGCLTGLEPRERGAARVPRVPRALRSRGPHLPDLRLQGQAGPRQHPRRPTSARLRSRSPSRRGQAPSTTSAAAGRTPSRSSRRSPGSRS